MPNGKAVLLLKEVTAALKERAIRDEQVMNGDLPKDIVWVNNYPVNKCFDLVKEAEEFLANYQD